MNIQTGEVRSRYDERKEGRSKLAMAPFPSSSNLKFLEVIVPFEVIWEAVVPNLAPPSFNVLRQVLWLLRDVIVDGDVVVPHH